MPVTDLTPCFMGHAAMKKDITTAPPHLPLSGIEAEMPGSFDEELKMEEEPKWKSL
jgi:hypothetical protein